VTTTETRTTVLATEGLCVRYGGVRALDQVNLEVHAGQLVGLIGANGAGKTTFVDAITGFTGAQGRITLGGHDIGTLAPHRRAMRGLARTWQSTELFDDLTVSENLAVACGLPATRRLLSGLLRARAYVDPRVDESLALLDLGPLCDELPTSLSLGQRKLVGVARALVAQPMLLCLDEPAAGLDARESRVLGGRLRQLVEGGITTLLIDHDMNLVLSVCDYVYVLDFGQVIAHGTPQEIRVNEAVIQAHLGRPGSPAVSEEVVHEAEGLGEATGALP
jgi:branched-chain amino acid transport system ATP-binding protein